MSYLQNLISKLHQNNNVVQPRPQSRFDFSETAEQRVHDNRSKDDLTYTTPSQAELKENITTDFSKNLTDKKIEATSDLLQTPPEKKVISQTKTSFPEIKDHQQRIVTSEKSELKTVPQSTSWDSETKNIMKESGSLFSTPSLKQTKGILNHVVTKASNESTSSRHLKNEQNFHQQAPTIKISIGRVEVKTVAQEKKKPMVKKQKNQPIMSLEDYINSKK